MPINENEFENHHLHHSSYGDQQFHAMSKAEQRRSNKPIMEKRRRARINHCLNELKTLILDAMKKDPARHSKLEKADILEMTVKHLQTIQRQQLSTAVGTDPTVLHKFKNGFNECATEVSRYINHMEGIENCVKQRLVSHLASCVSGLQQISPQLTSTYQGTNSNNNNNSNNSLFLNNTSNNLSQQNSSISSLSEDVNNNHASSRLQSMMTSLQLIPSRLPTGELALLLPNSQQLPGNVLPFFPPPPPNVVTSTTSTMLQQSQLPVPSNDSGENIHNHYRNHPIPSTTTTSETTPINTIDRMQHISAFTAVCRPTMIKDNQRNYSLTKSPMVSPTSSITSSSSINYDDTTPPKTITDMSPNTSVSSEISSTSLLQIENNIKNKNSNFLTTKLTTPPVLAVKPLPLLKENNSNNTNLLLKTVPTYYNIKNEKEIKNEDDNEINCNNNENNEMTILPLQKQKNLPQSLPVHIPLTVVTNDNINNRLTMNNNDLRYQHPALDFSLKKDNNCIINNKNNKVSLKRTRNEFESNTSDENFINNCNITPISFSPKILKLSNDSIHNNNNYNNEIIDKIEDLSVGTGTATAVASSSFDSVSKSTIVTTTIGTMEMMTQINNNSNNNNNNNNNNGGDMWRPW